MKKITAHSFGVSASHKETPGKEVWASGFVSCDSYAVAAAIDENFVTELAQIGLSVELSGSLTRGMMIADWTNKLKKKNKTFIMRSCNLEKLQDLLMAALK